MLEHNRRREGVIVRFDESLVWESADSLKSGGAPGWGGVFDSYRNAEIDAFGSSKIAESPWAHSSIQYSGRAITWFRRGASFSLGSFR